MRENKLDAVIIPSGDPHQSEYIADYWAIRAWMSGFSGSSGTLIVLSDYAALWTDPRYFLQAEEELRDSCISLHKQKVPHAPEHIPWLIKKLSSGNRIGLDGRLFSISQISNLKAQISALQISLNTQYDPFDRLWSDRPPLPLTPVFEFPAPYAYPPGREKINKVREKLLDLQADYLILSALDDIAWVLNLRGNDIPFNPLFYAYLIIGKNTSLFFINEKKIPPDLRDALCFEKITLLPYHSIEESITRLGKQATFVIHPESLNSALYQVIPSENILFQPNWIMELKAIKTEFEVKHLKHAARKDGIALLRAFRWLEKGLKEGKRISEFDFAEKCSFFRSQQPDYQGESFNAIVGFNQNGAVIHYRPNPQSAAIIEADGLLLVDSGGQYFDGTTDITRTIFIGQHPSDEMKKHFTLVLKGFISLASVQFPPGTVGMQLDTLARMSLWKYGLDFAHGTGHGVGFYLSVHEGPQGFANNPSTSRGTTAFQPGMITTNEPGLYFEGKYGIRIENMLLCKKQSHSFLCFEDITLFPIATNLINLSLLNPDEKEWLNHYHRFVWDGLSPHISDDEKIWLHQQCAPI
jgi:Xaa-Pro aminopeptidase